MLGRVLSRRFSGWRDVPAGPPDPILGVAEAFKRDADPAKVNLGIGAYRDDDAKPWKLLSVVAAEKVIYDSAMDHEYLPIDGLGSFTSSASKLMYGNDATAVAEGKVVNV
jgi:aspartate aminotransferase